jgi:hypothetical protein
MRQPSMQTPAGSTPRVIPQPPTPPGSGPVTVPGNGAMPLEVLQAQAIDLARQLAGYSAQRVVVDRQLRRGNFDAQARSQVVLERANLDVQIAQADAELANVRAQIAAHQGVPVDRVSQGGSIVPSEFAFPKQRSVEREMVIGMSFVLLMAIAVPMSIAYARRVWRGKPQPIAPRLDEIAPRLDRLEHAVDAIAIEIERISEGQRFVTRILAERPAAPRQADALDSAGDKSIRALGAGAVEPLGVAERQAARSSRITPN